VNRGATTAPDDQAEPEPPPLPENRSTLEKLDPGDRSRLARAILEARKMFGPACAELIEQDISEWSQFGFRLDNKALMPRVVAELLAASEPKSAVA
jgi:hypothetical protein